MSDTFTNDGSESRGPIDQGLANDIVGDNLQIGLNADDLGIDREDVFEGLDLEEDMTQQGFDDLSAESQQTQQRQERQQPEFRTQQQQQPQQRPLPQHSLVKPDNKGNLVDANGQIIARAGAEARHYQKFAKHFEAPLRAAASQIAQARQGHSRLQNNLNQAVEIGQQLAERVRELSTQQQNGDFGREFGLSRDEMIQAATFARQAKADPASALKSLLTLAAARGIDLKSVLGPNAQGAGLDTKAILDLVRGEITNAVKPIQDRTAAEKQQQEQQREFQNQVTAIQNEARSFFESTPDAVPFLEAFRAIKTDPNLRHLSMAHIWSEIQLRLARSGHSPQSYINTMRQKQQGIRNGMTMPRGRQRGTMAAPEAPASSREGMAPVATSYEDIVRDLLRSA